MAMQHHVGGGPQEGARQCGGRKQLAPPHWPHPDNLDEGQNPATINLGDCGLLPKGGGDYRAIGPWEPLWKVVERIMDRQLNALPLHEALHRCQNGRGTGMAILEAKLSQQLAHLKQEPFYRVFLDLK
jgi:hypothetical protein